MIDSFETLDIPSIQSYRNESAYEFDSDPKEGGIQK